MTVQGTMRRFATAPSELHVTRRSFVGGLLASGAVLLGESHALAAGGKLHVFAVTSARPRSLASDMEAKLGGITVTVFGRVGDFKRAVETENPDAIMAPPPVLAMVGKSPQLQGTKGGSATEPYVIVSSAPIAAGDLGKKTIGALDMVGRSELPVLVKQIIGSSTVPNVSRVTKIEDLLPLLQFNTADAIVFPERFLGEFKSKSKLTLVVQKPPSAQVGCIAVSFAGNRGPVESGLRSLPGGVMGQLGVDGWK